MALVHITPPFETFRDVDGNPLDAGYIFVGVENLEPVTNPQAAYWDIALTIPAAQPIRTIGGYPSRAGTPASIYCAADYSILVRSKNGGLVYSAQSSAGKISLSDDFVDVVQPFTGAVARTQHSKNAENLSLADFLTPTELADVVGNVGAVDVSVSVQNAFNAGATFAPRGTYLLANVSIPSNLNLQGEGDLTIFKQKSVGAGAQAMLVVDSGSASLVDNISGITLRDIQLRGTSDTDGFSEFVHLMALSGVSSVALERVTFKGFRGDGLYLGSGLAGGQERHNTDVLLTDCVFDGVDQSNRNAVSIIDCDEFLAESCSFKNCTSAGMPGAVDVEPDANSYHVIRHISVKNCGFYNIGGNVGAIAVSARRSVLTDPAYDFQFIGNHFDTVSTKAIFFSGDIVGGVTESSSKNSLVVRDNVILSAGNGFYISGVAGASVDGNFLNDTNGSYLGFTSVDQKCLDISISGNVFHECGSVGQVGLNVFSVDRVRIENNTFNDCGDGAAGSYALDFGTGTSDNLLVVGNKFLSPTAKTLFAIQKEAGHTFTPLHNIYHSNVLNALGNNFQWQGGAWTPVIRGTTAAGAGTYTVQAGRYARIQGDRVLFEINIAWSAHTGTGNMLINLPVAPASAGVAFVPVNVMSQGIVLPGGAQSAALIDRANGRMAVFYSNVGTVSAMPMTGTATLYISGEYEVDAL